jgi:hypothetical protein
MWNRKERLQGRKGGEGGRKAGKICGLSVATASGSNGNRVRQSDRK